MKVLPTTMQVVDMQTGEVVETRPSGMNLMPPHKDACQVCGRLPAHAPDQPHNAQSLYYQYAFFSDHGRWPTWRDAVAHCSEPVRAAWEAELRRRDAWPKEGVS